MSRPKILKNRQRTTVIMEHDIHEDLKVAARRRGLSYSRLAALVLTRFVEADKAKMEQQTNAVD